MENLDRSERCVVIILNTCSKMGWKVLPVDVDLLVALTVPCVAVVVECQYVAFVNPTSRQLREEPFAIVVTVVVASSL